MIKNRFVPEVKKSGANLYIPYSKGVLGTMGGLVKPVRLQDPG